MRHVNPRNIKEAIEAETFLSVEIHSEWHLSVHQDHPTTNKEIIVDVWINRYQLMKYRKRSYGKSKAKQASDYEYLMKQLGKIFKKSW